MGRRNNPAPPTSAFQEKEFVFASDAQPVPPKRHHRIAATWRDLFTRRYRAIQRRLRARLRRPTRHDRASFGLPPGFITSAFFALVFTRRGTRYRRRRKL
jgi:hypothetical protein